MAHRRLANELHCLTKALPADEEVTARVVARNPLGGVGQEGKDDRGEHLVLLEQLVGVEPLSVPQRTELHRLGHHRRLRVDVALGTLEISGDSFDEKRDVIEQLVRRKYPLA